jgi:hypothetical protein
MRFRPAPSSSSTPVPEPPPAGNTARSGSKTVAGSVEFAKGLLPHRGPGRHDREPARQRAAAAELALVRARAVRGRPDIPGARAPHDRPRAAPASPSARGTSDPSACSQGTTSSPGGCGGASRSRQEPSAAGSSLRVSGSCCVAGARTRTTSGAASAARPRRGAHRDFVLKTPRRVPGADHAAGLDRQHAVVSADDRPSAVQPAGRGGEGAAAAAGGRLSRRRRRQRSAPRRRGLDRAWRAADAEHITPGSGRRLCSGGAYR